MEATGVNPECRCKIFKQAPHFCKPLQLAVSISVLITVITISGGYTDPLWQTALASLLFSGAATAIFFFGVQHNLVKRYSCGKLTWNAVEFLYSLVLLVFCITSAIFAFGRSSGYYEVHTFLYIFCGVLFVVLFISFLIPLLYIAREEFQILTEKPEAVRTGNTNVPEPKPENFRDSAEYANYLESLLEY